MKQIKTNLFIGGVMDGMVKEMPDGYEGHMRLYFALPVLSNPFLETDGCTLEWPSGLDPEEYRRERLRADDTLFDVWVEKSVTLTEAMTKLLADYRPEKKGVKS